MGTPFFLAEPSRNAWNSPGDIGTTTVRVELFCNNPDAVIKRALEAGATGSLAHIQDHQRPWGTHLEGAFTDPFGQYPVCRRQVSFRHRTDNTYDEHGFGT